MTQGIILFAHGAADPRWAAPFEAVAERVRTLSPGSAVRLSYLERMAPDLPTAGAELAAAGCSAVTVLPLFLGTGGHVRRDLPLLIDALRAAHPQVGWTLEPAAGEHALVAEALAQVAAASLRAP